MPPPPANPRCDIVYTVGGADAALRNSLIGEGPLEVAAVHWFSAVMGHVLPPAVNARVQISMRLVNYVVETDIVYDNAVRALNPSFTVRATALSALFVAAEAAGLDFARVSGDTLELAAFQARACFRATARALPLATRSMGLTEVLPPPPPARGGAQVVPPLWGALNIDLFVVASDADLAVWSQLRQCFSHCFAHADFATAQYTAQLAALQLLGGQNFAALPAPLQAPVLVPVFRETCRASELDLFLPAGACVLELVRRSRPSESSRFQQLFEQNWRGFDRLNSLWPHPMGGAEAVWRTRLLATKLPGSEGQLIDSTVRAVDIALADALPSLETSALRGASNEARTAGVLPGLVAALSQAKAEASSTPNEAWSALVSAPGYQQLLAALEPLANASPLDTLAIAELLASSRAPAGLLFFENKIVPHAHGPIWSKLAAVNSTSVLDALLNKAVAVDLRGQVRTDWGLLVKPGIGKSMLSGSFKLSGSNALNIFRSLLEKPLQRRHGRFVHTDPGDHPIALFLDYDLLTDARPLLESAFACIGYGGTAASTFPSVLQGFLKRLKRIVRLPDEAPQKTGLLRDYVEAVELCFAGAADERQLLLRSKLPFATHAFCGADMTDIVFISNDSSGPQKFVRMDAELERVYSELELDPERRSVGSLRNVSGGTSKSSLSDKQIRHALSIKQKGIDKRNPQDDEDTRTYDYPPGFSSRLGGLAIRYGVAVSDPPGYAAFGHTITGLADGVNMDPAEIKCIADLAPGVKDKWCPLGKDKCPRHGGKHVAPPSLEPEDKCLVRVHMKDAAADIGNCKWITLVAPANNDMFVGSKEGGASSSLTLYRGGDDDRRQSSEERRGGRGRGKGKGSAGRGRGRQGFRRQR